MVKDIQATHIVDLADVVEGRHVITAAVNPHGDPLLLALKQSPDYRTIKPGGASFAKRRADVPNAFSIHYLANDEWYAVNLEPTDENYHSIQPLGQEHWLLVRGRASDSHDQNASVYDMNGRRQWSFHVGDGVEDVQVSERSTVWVSYFDEGVYGDTDLAKSGLVSLDRHGEPIFRYDSLYARSDVPVICDCYAMNVCSDKEIWLYYYPDFPLVKLVDGKLNRWWPEIPVEGATAFAVSGQRVLFCGSYDKSDLLFLLDLSTMSVEEIAPRTGEGSRIEGFRGMGRRSRLTISTDQSLYCVDLNEL